MTVVVGVSGAVRSLTAIQLAAQEASCRDAPLIAVMAYSGERALGAPATPPVAGLRTDGDRVAAESILRDAIRDALSDQADGVELRAVQGLAGRKLVETAARAGTELVVLSCRSGVSMRPGTVSQYVLQNAPCPVLVVPEGGGHQQPATGSGPAYPGRGST
jgi:nucleotide-binding universal stress UspA family protein